MSALCHHRFNLVTSKGKSSIAIFALFFMTFFASLVQAHETRPAIADVAVSEEEVSLTIDINIEAFVAGIDLSSVTDTNEAAEAKTYDELRALSPEEMQVAFKEFWPEMQTGFKANAGQAPIELRLVSVNVQDNPNLELLRDATIELSAALPDGDASVTLGWDSKFGPLVLRQVEGGDDAYTAFLRNGEVSDPLPRIGTATQSTWSVFIDYVVAGFEHIIPLGADHILFVLGLFFLSVKFKPLILQVTTFTLAHTVTLALGALGIITIAPEIVEPLIALSIVYVAIENIFASEMKPWRLVVILLFGLLHGLGFASVLGDFGLSEGKFVTSLVGFNIGVELGQLAVIVIALFAVGLWFGKKPWYRKVISIPASLIIAAIGAYWFIERTLL